MTFTLRKIEQQYIFYAEQVYRCIIANQVLQNNEQKLDPVFVSLKLIFISKFLLVSGYP